MVYNLALNYVQNVEDAEEITQDVFVAVHSKLNTFRKESEYSTWIYRITINRSLDHVKAKKRKKRFAFFTSLFYEDANSIDHKSFGIDHPGVALEQKEALSEIFRLINDLPVNQKTALILTRLEGKSQIDVADIMEISQKAVESLVSRAKKNLENKLQNAKDL